MAKSTHSGHCQICGHLQKLPGGRLAKHGYTTQWGYFTGTCPGSHGLPLEVSCDLIAGEIHRANQFAQTYRDAIREAEAGTCVWVEITRPSFLSGKTIRTWHKLLPSEVTEVATYPRHITWKDGDKIRKQDVWCNPPETPARDAHPSHQPPVRQLCQPADQRTGDLPVQPQGQTGELGTGTPDPQHRSITPRHPLAKAGG